MSTIKRATPVQARRKLAGLQVRTGSRTAGFSSPSDWTFLTGGAYPDVLPAGESAAMGMPPFGRGVALLANAVAGTNWFARRWDADLGVSVRLADQPSVLTDPDPQTDPWHYRWSATEDLILYGNHFALFGDIDWRTLRPGWLVPLPADDVWLIVDPETGAYTFTVGGEMLSPDELLHVSAGNRSGEVLGRGVLRQYGAWLGGAVAAEEHAGSYFAGGALPPAVLQSPTVLTAKQAAELKESWREMTSTREPVVMPSGYVLTPIVSDAERAQLVQSRTWNAQAVAIMLGIPAYKMGLPGTSMTYQNIEDADIEFVRDSVDRFAGGLLAAFTKWLMPRGTDVAWDYAGRMRADAVTTSQVLSTLLGAQVITVDEARSMIGRAPMDAAHDEGQTPVGVPELTPAEVPQ
jgi:HK97 family phage portal protein